MNKSNEWYLYMLLCDQKTFYVGIASDPKLRLQQHRDKKNIATKEFSELKIVYCEKYLNKFDVAKREKQTKGWSHTKKQMLIDGKFGINVCTEFVEV